MDVSKVSKDILNCIDIFYDMEEEILELEPNQMTSKNLKKIRKTKKIICKFILDSPDLAENYYQIKEYIDKDSDNMVFAEFMKACHNQVLMFDNEKKNRFEETSDGLGKEVKNLLWKMIKDEILWDNITKVGENIQIVTDLYETYIYTLTLLNVDDSFGDDVKFDSIESLTLSKENDKYILSGQLTEYEEDTSTPFSIRFTSAELDVKIFRADIQPFGDSPWCYLSNVASEIIGKCNVSKNLLNESEKDNLPLIMEISKLSEYGWNLDLEEYKSKDFPKLKSIIAKYGFKELTTLVEELENNFSNSKKERVLKKLLYKLNSKEYEIIWRDIYKIISETQKDYPSQASVLVQSSVPEETRAKIQSLMENHGYKGEYPDFVKQGSVKGSPFVNSYGDGYFVNKKKNAVFHIHCTESFHEEGLAVEFLCGTEMLDKDETMGDIYSCSFISKGNTFFTTVNYESDYVDESGEAQSQNLETRVQIAVKKAELKKLSKEERKEIGYNFSLGTVLAILLFSVVIGGLLSAVIIAVFMLIGVLIGLIVSLIFPQPDIVPSMFTEIPWFKIFLFGWLIIGGFIGISGIFSIVFSRI